MDEFPTELSLSSWNEFVIKVDDLLNLVQKRKSQTWRRVTELLFRGHSDSSWRLETTLERGRIDANDVVSYFDIATEIYPRFASLHGLRFDMPDRETIRSWARPGHAPCAPPAYDYLAYLRHHGFPSPLLDWTRSPYVAAYFAFRDFTSDVDSVSIYALWEVPGVTKGGTSAEPRIWRIGPNVITYHRHFRQQSEYTICLGPYNVDPKEQASWEFANHEDVVGASRARHAKQDLICKITMPASERKAALDYLALHNIDEYTLFGSEGALARGAWWEFVRRTS